MSSPGGHPIWTPRGRTSCFPGRGNLWGWVTLAADTAADKVRGSLGQPIVRRSRKHLQKSCCHQTPSFPGFSPDDGEQGGGASKSGWPSLQPPGWQMVWLWRGSRAGRLRGLPPRCAPLALPQAPADRHPLRPANPPAPAPAPAQACHALQRGTRGDGGVLCRGATARHSS